MVFGNIKQSSFAEIWSAPAYSAFRRSNQTNQLPAPCRDCARRRMHLITKSC
ncbi:MAG: SPASM domain-containing protein [Desulfobulbus sp.]